LLTRIAPQTDSGFKELIEEKSEIFFACRPR
jgi:hypothetical protein